MEMPDAEMEERSVAKPPASRLLREQHRGLAIILGGLSILLLASLPWRFFVRPALTVKRLPEHRLDFQIDLNQATWAELIQLPGIGPNLAERILVDRETNGLFAKPTDLARVRGIGPQILGRVLPFLDASTPPLVDSEETRSFSRPEKGRP